MSSRRFQNSLTSRASRTIADVGEDDRRELIDGTLYQLPMTSFEHGHIASLIVMAIGPAYQLGKDGPGGWWIQGENDFEVDGREVFRPDAVGWRKERLPRRPKGKRIDVVPDWVCEVLSPSTRSHDLKTKAKAYARIGVAHRWYIDPEVRTFHAFELMHGRWVESGVFCDDDFVCAKPFETMGISMGDWWGEPKNATCLKMTPRQAEFLAFIHAYTKIHRRPPAEHEICSRLSLSPPSVHDAIMRMEKAGLIARTPRQARSITILVPERDIPPFEEKAR
jgi:Uma2 family endonuclease